MNLDERGARAASVLDHHIRDNVDPAHSLRILYQQTGYRARSRRRRPAAMVVAFAAVVAIIGVLVAVGVWSSNSSTHVGGKHAQHLPAGPTPTAPTPSTTRVAACVSPCFTLHLLRADNHQPFPAGGETGGKLGGALARICPVASCPDQGSGPTVVFPLADANGDVVVRGLDPAVEYDFLPMVINMPGWSCPDYTDPNTGDNYLVPPAPVTPTAHDVTGTPTALDNTTFFIDDCG